MALFKSPPCQQHLQFGLQKTGGLLIIHFSDIQTEKQGASETEAYLQGNTL